MVNKQELSEALRGLEERMEKNIKKEMKQQLKEQSQELKSTLEEYVNKKIEEVQASIYEEMTRIISNQRNVIMNGISEDKDAKTEVEKILKELNMTEAVNDISTVFRLGKQQANKTRPVKVCFFSHDSAEKALRNGRTLKARDINIYINEDLTKNQMTELKKLKEEAKRRNHEKEDLKNGEAWVVSGRRSNPRLRKWRHPIFPDTIFPNGFSFHNVH